MHVQLLIDRSDVVAHGIDRDPEPLANFPIAVALCQHPHDANFVRGEGLTAALERTCLLQRGDYLPCDFGRHWRTTLVCLGDRVDTLRRRRSLEMVTAAP